MATTIQQLQYRVGELERQARGIPRANASSAQAHRRIDELATSVARLAERESRVGDGPVQQTALTQEIQRVETRLDALWGDLEAELSQLRDRVDNHDKRLDLHDAKFASHGERIESVELTANANASAIARVSRAVSNVHPAAYVLAAAVGVCAGLVWSFHDWTTSATVNGVRATVENTAANTWWAASLAGLGAAFIVFFLLSLVMREGVDQEATVTAQAGAQARVRARQAEPTRVIPAAAPQPQPGANQGAVNA